MFQSVNAPVTEARRAARMDELPTVFVVDDDISVRESLEPLFKSAGLRTVSFAGATEFLAYAKPSAPSCLVLDVRLPDVSGLDLQERFASAAATMPIVFISGHIDIPTAVRAIKGGAVEFLMKPLRDDVLLGAIERAMVVSSDALRRDVEMSALRDRYASLTRRESEVMALVVAGRLNKQVAAELDISEITVKAHRGKVMRKMKARSLADLVKMAGRIGVGG